MTKPTTTHDVGAGLRRAEQPDLGLFPSAPTEPNIDWFVTYLSHRDWTTAAEILTDLGRSYTDNNTRWLRALAKSSRGRIAGGQRGYKLVTRMTHEEFHHWRNWMKSQADEMTARILEADKVFYARQPTATANGILNP